jgi:hypothetical protein
LSATSALSIELAAVTVVKNVIDGWLRPQRPDH